MYRYLVALLSCTACESTPIATRDIVDATAAETTLDITIELPELAIDTVPEVDVEPEVDVVEDTTHEVETVDEVLGEIDVSDDAEAEVPELFVGDRCAGDEDCGEDELARWCVRDEVYWLDGYCLHWGCTVDDDCPLGAHCGFFGTGLDVGSCVADCDKGTCARADHACWDIDGDGRDECAPAATGTRTVGAPCETIADCAGGGGGECLRAEAVGIEGGYCTTSCVVDADCADGICQGRGTTGRGTCQTACATSADCLATQACADRDFDGRDECGARGEGPVPQNGLCTNQLDCGTGPDGFCLGGANFPGYCTANCRGDDDCVGASHCVALEGLGTGYCLPDCPAPCPGNSACVDFDGDGRRECGPRGSGTTLLGLRCEAAGDCAGGAGYFCAYPDLVCTHFCSDDGDCGANGTCHVDTCRRRCDDDNDCDTGLSCIDIDLDGGAECVPLGYGLVPVGGACAASDYCLRDANLLCRGDAPGGICTRVCDAAHGCPDGSHCGTLADDDVCLAGCTLDDDCRAGWACFDGDGDGASECRPYGGGPGRIGDACATVADCNGGELARCLNGPASFGGVCSLVCQGEAACGPDANCATLPDHDERVCLPACDDDDACRVGYACVDVAPQGERECVYACDSDSDCAFFRGAGRCVDRLCTP